MLSWEEYFDRIVSLQLQFNLARGVIASFRKTPEAVKDYMDQDLEDWRKLITEGAKIAGEELKDHWAFTDEGTKSYFDSARKRIDDDLKKVENRLNQNQLIMRVSFLEGFIKEIHREVLRQQPTLLKSDRQVPLGKLLAVGQEKIFEEEIEREVQSLDRKSIEDRCKYFLDKLSIDWFDGKIVPLMQRVFDKRNDIIHLDPNTDVTYNNLRLASLVGIAVPWVSIAQAAVLYPKGFKMIENLDPETARKLLPKRSSYSYRRMPSTSL